MNLLQDLVLLSLAVGAISMTIAKSKALTGLRDYISKLGSWAEELIHCPYCVSHWLAVGSVLTWFKCSMITLLILSAAVVGLSSLVSLGITHFFLALNALEDGDDE